MDCAEGRATDLHYDGVQIDFLPPNTKALIQPLDQGVIQAIKATALIQSLDQRCY